MSDQFLAEIRIFGCNFAPTGWAFCNGQILPISQNTALFSLCGTNYGGNGTSNFGLPNLQGMAAMDAGSGPGLSPRVVGETSGATTVTLQATEMPAHTHTMQGVGGIANRQAPANTDSNSATIAAQPLYSATAGNTPMALGMLSTVGNSQPHNNMQPYQVLNYCIALQGIFPPRS